jgi:hypothetical protein
MPSSRRRSQPRVASKVAAARQWEWFLFIGIEIGSDVIGYDVYRCLMILIDKSII